MLRPHTIQGTGSDGVALSSSVDETSFDYLQPIAATAAGAGSGALGSAEDADGYEMPTGANMAAANAAAASTSAVGASYLQAAATASTPTSSVLGPGPEYELEAGKKFKKEAALLGYTGKKRLALKLIKFKESPSPD